MIKGILKHSFIKYLSSYIICLILPVLFFSLVYKNYFIEDYSQQFTKRAIESLDNTYEYIDLQITNIKNISYQILSSRQVSDITFQDNPPIITYYSIGEILSNYINTNEAIFDIWLFEKHNRIYYCSRQMFDADSFKKFGPSYPDIPYKEFEEFLYASYYPLWIGEKNINIYNQTYPIITYIAAYPYSNTFNNCILVFHLEKSIFEQPLKSVIQWEQSTSEIIDHNGNIIYSMNHEMRPVVDAVISGYNIHEDGAMLVDINHQKYLVNIKNSTENGLKYLSIISYGHLIADAQKFTQIFIAIIVIIILSGSALIFMLMKYNYNPILQLIRYSKKHLNLSPGQSSNISDIDQIRVAIENIVDKNTSLAQYNKKYMQERILFQLVKGTSDINLNEVYQSGIDCSGNYFVAVIFRMEKNVVNDIDEFENVFIQAMSVLSYSYNTYFIEYLEQHSFIVIFTGEENDPNFKQKIDALSQEIAKITDSDIFACIGNPCENIKDISYSFTQARAVLRYQMNKNTEKTISFSDLHDEEAPNYLYLKAELNTLHDSIVDRNPAKIEFIISQLIDTVKSVNTSYFFAICVCYDIINTIFKGIHDIKGSTEEFVKKYQSVFRQTFDHTIDDLISIIISLSQEVISHIDKETNSNIAVNCAAILKYVEENYKRSDFSVQSIADHFGLSVSNLSHQFKAYTGDNISSYVNILKMKYAKELLLTTDLSISEIAAKLGYFQTSSFIRKFKQEENMTPGEYRNRQVGIN